MSSNPVLFAAQAPGMSEALLIEGNDLQSRRYISNHATMYMLEHFDVFLKDITVDVVDADTPQGYSIF